MCLFSNFLQATSTESVKYSDPVSDISVKTNRKRKPEQESNHQKKKTKASLKKSSQVNGQGSEAASKLSSATGESTESQHIATAPASVNKDKSHANTTDVVLLQHRFE